MTKTELKELMLSGDLDKYIKALIKITTVLILVLLPIIAQAQIRMRLDSVGTVYIIPKQEASVIDYWARKGIVADTLLYTMNGRLVQLHNEITFYRLKSTELANNTIGISKELEKTVKDYNVLLRSYNESSNAVTTLTNKIRDKEKQGYIMVIGIGLAFAIFVLSK